MVCDHIPADVRLGVSGPRQKREVLLGPSHLSAPPKGFDINTLNTVVTRTESSGKGERPYFGLIRDLYPDGSATSSALSGHPADVIFPYSAFSISMVELYQMNIPFFVPTDDLLVDAMDDVRLAPPYHHESSVAMIEHDSWVKGKELGYLHSPHSSARDAQRYWLQFAFFNQVENAIRFSSPEELVTLLMTTDLNAVRAKMEKENARIFSEEFSKWESITSPPGPERKKE